jgi:hypothetical protein
MMPWSALMEDACRFFERHLNRRAPAALVDPLRPDA